MNPANRAFLVAGGGSGLGAATVRMLAARDANVVIADWNEGPGQALAAEIGANACFIKTDVGNESMVTAAVSLARERFGSLWGAVNCAGVATGEKVVGKEGPHRLESFARTVQINLIGTFNVLRLAAEAMTHNTPDESGERGIIVNTASVAAFDGQIGQAAYSASKAGVVGMALPIARELARHGIRVMTIAPGLFDTPMMAGLPEDVRASLGQQVPFPFRLGHPEEYAMLVGHIVENTMLNGEVIRLDGAIRMAPK